GQDDLAPRWRRAAPAAQEQVKGKSQTVPKETIVRDQGPEVRDQIKPKIKSCRDLEVRESRQRQHSREVNSKPWHLIPDI
ncbi:MAG: hypothetical protein MUO88_05385, partial [Desulfobacterales bacterium]|nr:hypothetical protein [Desulfobacterales bacterium]